MLFVLADTPAYAVVIGKADFSDAHNTIKLDHLRGTLNNRAADSRSWKINSLREFPTIAFSAFFSVSLNGS